MQCVEGSLVMLILPILSEAYEDHSTTEDGPITQTIFPYFGLPDQQFMSKPGPAPYSIHIL